ncbi:MGMT family protein [Rhodococcus qingshengii]|uniref:MGMT family protein n=1 Tax=Rhodococcus qingshengii TaxID=334542 RepID=UPI0022B58F84|nr:MGMT family protein [Rhodococcus qingshengii]MCZ4618679.1 MGMT family protein [Rhodococcus qingshengii]
MSELSNGTSEEGPSSFDRRALDIIDRIPSGRVMTYGAIASLVHAHPRHIGRVMTQWADETHWHRVVYADGTPARCHGNSAADLLREEGTPMSGGRVDVRRARWDG